RLAMGGVSNDALAGIDMARIQTVRRPLLRHHLAGDNLAKRKHLIGTPRGALAHRGNTPQELLQRVEILFKFGMEASEERRAQQFTGGSVVALSHRAVPVKRR